MAAWLFERLIAGADAYVDLHSGGIDQQLLDFVGYRLTGDDELDAKIKAMAHAVDTSESSSAPARTAATATPRRTGRCPAILVETGKLGDRDPATVRRLLDALYRLLHHLGVIEAQQHLTPVTVQPRDWIWTARSSLPVARPVVPGRGRRRRGDRGADHRPRHRPGRRRRAQGRRRRPPERSSTGMNGLTVRPGTLPRRNRRPPRLTRCIPHRPL